MKTSKITNVVPNGTWNGQNGTMYKWTVTMENGEAGGVMTKTDPQTKWVIGTTVNYESSTNGQYTNFKLIEEKPQGGGFKGQPKDEGVITMLSCISSACNAVAQSNRFSDTKFIIEMANEFYNAAKSKSTLNK